MISLQGKRKAVYVSFLAICTVLFYLPISGFGFTIDNVLDNNTPADYSDDLKDAARWTNTPASLVKDGVRGLGGGIEYSISSDFFAKLIPSFIDSVPPTEEQLKEAIKRAFNTWAEGSPIYFTDVSDQIKPVRSRSWTGTVAELGAEIDILAVPDSDPVFRDNDFAGYTSFWYLYADPIGTNGKRLPGNTLTSVDIFFNTDVKYFFNPDDPKVHQAREAGQIVNHFESLLLHEIAHALALDHPDEFPYKNFDTDDDPFNKMAIDCEDPLQGLKLSPNIDPNAVATSKGSGTTVRLKLTNDDLGGRDFLYPLCAYEAHPAHGSWLWWERAWRASVGCHVIESRIERRWRFPSRISRCGPMAHPLSTRSSKRAG